MINYYEILGLNTNASIDQIKKAYRKLAKKFHPDVSSEKNSEEKFKQILKAYEVLSDPIKKRKYDDYLINNSYINRNFNDFVNSENFGSSNFASSDFSKNFRNSKIDKSFLNISLEKEIDLLEILRENKISLKIHKKIISENLNKEFKEIDIIIDLTKNLNISILEDNIGKFILIKLEGQGHEDFIEFENISKQNIKYFIFGDLILKIRLNFPKNIEITNDNDIIEKIEVPLNKILFKDEKIRISTYLKKQYDIDLRNAKKLDNLKISIKNQGLKFNNKIGNYIIKFEIPFPDFSNLNNDEINQLKQIFKKTK